MKPLFSPTTVAELADAVRSAPRLLAVGAGTKPRLSVGEVAKLSTLRLRGLVEYEPDEFTFTALAGTPISEIAAALAERGQHLPFDPMLAGAGATLGGTVASGLSGPGRFRFGGLRDFILGVRFVDGRGRLLRMGGKVVKNAAGFDLPKFLVGSLGRFGALGELTFKVFPRPQAGRTLRLTAESIPAAMQCLAEAANSRFEFEALDLPAGTTDIFARLAGPETALEPLARDALQRWPGEIVLEAEANALWRSVNEFTWAQPWEALLKVPVSPAAVAALAAGLASVGGVRFHLSAAGNVAWVSCPDPVPSPLDAVLSNLGLTGLLLRGRGPLWVGRREHPAIAAAVKRALDPEGRFPPLDE